MTRLFREPLLHFVLIAAVIFAAYSWLSQSRDRDERTILVTENDLDRMAALFTSEAGALPSEQDLRAMISDHVEQQALAREARRLGLADGDTVVERRLAQKMTFMITDTEAVIDPEPGELEAWYAANQELFFEPRRFSFQHVFFSESGDPDIAEVQQSLIAQPDSWRSAGNPFMLQRAYSELPPREIARLFGTDFTTALITHSQTDEQWSAPVQSALGTHLIRVTAVREGGLPELEKIRDRVASRWRDEQSRLRARAAINDVVAKYEIEIEGNSAP
ncbi:MAG: peptidylprolyl isomerase [Pseudomonadota bacterium]